MLSIEILRPYSRNGNFPIDTTSLFYSYDEAAKYASTDPSAYVGQVIAVDDKLLQKTAIYKVDYNSSDSSLKTLTEISVGTNDSVFALKGTVPTYADLIAYTNTYKKFINSGYMFYVETDETNYGKSSLYVSVKDNDGNIYWKKIDVDIQLNKIYADKTNDGIIRHQLFNTFIDSNSANNDSVYFSKSGTKVDIDGTPNNSWLAIEKSSDEKSSNTISSLTTAKKVVELINKNVDSSPELVVDTTDATQLFVDNALQPTFSFKYYPHAYGSIYNFLISINVNGRTETLATLSNFATTYHADGEYYAFSWKQPVINYLTQSADYPLTYIFTAYYKTSVDNLYASGIITKKLNFYFYDKVQIVLSGMGNYKNTSTVKAMDENEFDVIVDPTNLADDETINKITIIFPIKFEPEWIEYVPQQDYTALDLFSKEQIGDKMYYTLSISTTENIETDGFKTKVSFKVKQKVA